MAASERMATLIAELPAEVNYRTGHFGVIATREGFANSRAWLADTIAATLRRREGAPDDAAPGAPATPSTPATSPTDTPTGPDA